MEGNPDVIKVLNEVLRKELTRSINTSSTRKCARTGAMSCSANTPGIESIDEMKHADRIVERILFLEGVPNVQAYDRFRWDLTSSSNWRMISAWSRPR